MNYSIIYKKIQWKANMKFTEENSPYQQNLVAQKSYREKIQIWFYKSLQINSIQYE